MKNIFFVVALMMLMNNCTYSQNYLNDGGFEEGNSSINMTQTSPFNYQSVSRTSLPSTCIPSDIHWEKARSINSDFPGGYGGLRFKTRYWTDRGVFSLPSDCQKDCFAHLAHWGYNIDGWPSLTDQYNSFDIYYGYYGNEFTRGAASRFYAQSGNGCAIARPYTMFQQHMSRTMNHNGYYYVSGFVKKIDSESGTGTDDYLVNFILSEQQPKYADESCEASEAFANANYNRINNVDLGAGYGPDLKLKFPLSMADPTFDNWKYIEKEVYIGHRQNLSWLSVNVGFLSDDDTRENDVYAPYFGFDNLYVSDKECSCPIIRLLQNQHILSPSLIRAQQYVRAGYDVGNVGTNTGNVQVFAGGTGKTEFRAGNYISLEPGFSVEYGANFEANIRNCYDEAQPINLLFAPDAYSPNCDGINDEFCFYVENATSFTMHVYNQLFQQIADLSGTIPSESGPYEVCLDIPLDVPGDDNTYVYFLNLYGCQGEKLFTQDAFTAFSATEGCYAAKTEYPARHYIDNSVTTANPNTNVESFKIFPDPACDYLKIKYSDYSIEDQVKIYDVAGKAILSFTNVNPDEKYDISSLQNGVYSLAYFSKNNFSTQKFVKICQ